MTKEDIKRQILQSAGQQNQDASTEHAPSAAPSVRFIAMDEAIKNYESDRNELHKTAQSGDSCAQLKLGDFYIDNLSDEDEAKKWYRMAASSHGDEAVAIEATEKLGRLVIYDGVTAIVDNAFEGCWCLRNILIPDTVKSIGKSAFKDCINLERIVLPRGVTSIGKDAFRGCRMLAYPNMFEAPRWRLRRLIHKQLAEEREVLRISSLDSEPTLRKYAWKVLLVLPIILGGLAFLVVCWLKSIYVFPIVPYIIFAFFGSKYLIAELPNLDNLEGRNLDACAGTVAAILLLSVTWAAWDSVPGIGRFALLGCAIGLPFERHARIALGSAGAGIIATAVIGLLSFLTTIAVIGIMSLVFSR